MKKKLIIGTIGILVIISISIFIIVNLINKKGNIENVEVVIGESEIYSEQEIQSSIDIVLNKFKDFPATLNKIWYDEEKSKDASKAWAEQYNADEAIILYSNFKTYKGEQATNSGLNSDSEYSNWSWILVRINKGKWKLMTWGY